LKKQVFRPNTTISPLRADEIKHNNMKIPRILISAASSGSGKTLITCGILQALKNRNIKVTAFKCGPDYIDPMFHKKVLKTSSKNLDTFFTDKEVTRYLFAKTARNYDISIIEGVMGYYDGAGGVSEWGSAYELSHTLEAPVILVINGKGMSLSIAAFIKGFMEFRRNSNIKGVILNQVSPMFYKELKTVIEAELPIKVLGYVPRVDDFVLESRHLGLVIPDEILELEYKIQELSLLLEKTLDIDEILRLSKDTVDFEAKDFPVSKLSDSPTIAVAKDEAFCFYYEDNLELMKQMGAKLIFFSLIHDAHLPGGIDGILLGGGYPELYAKQLSENKTMLSEMKEYVENNRPILAECGGFMYLHDIMEDNNSQAYPMAGAIRGKVYKTNQLGRFGYITLSAKDEVGILTANNEIRGHEFHYFDSTSCGEAYLARKPLRQTNWSCIHGNKKQCMGFPHLYYYSNPEFIFNFLNRCIEGSAK
jgi:cobyrinic acid a,c-diamide synthase